MVLKGDVTDDPNVITTCELNRILCNKHFLSSHMINLRETDQYFIECEYVQLSNMSNTALESVNQNSLLMKTQELHILKSRVSNVFLKNVSKITVGSFKLNIYTRHVDEDVTFTTIFNFFPHLSLIMIHTAYFGWLTDLSSLGKRLKSIFIADDNFERMFSFMPDELYDFVAKQGPQFHLQLHIKMDNIHQIDKIKPFIDARFQPGKEGDGNFIVSICFVQSRSEEQFDYVCREQFETEMGKK
uniref:FTH domain-containing protein n=1 Tax=Panagrellus redivivus TaxID=6233 RepID=A0A7E4V9R1_PANRE